MKVRVKLFATLTDYLPEEAKKTHQMELELPEEATIAQAIDGLRLPPRLVHLVLVNGLYVGPEERATQCLRDGDTLALWPPIAGG